MNWWRTFFSNLTITDGILAILFVVVVAVLGNNLFPGIGAVIGVLVALLLLYLAKRRRDSMTRR